MFFKRKNHQKKLKNAINTSNEIYKVATQIFDEMWKYESIRLIGIRLDNLVVQKVYQTSLFENENDIHNDETLDKLMDDLQKKYGNKIIEKASLK